MTPEAIVMNLLMRLEAENMVLRDKDVKNLQRIKELENAANTTLSLAESIPQSDK